MTRGELNLLRIASTVALGGFLVGFDATVISGAVPFVRDYFGLGGSAGSLKLGWAVSCLQAKARRCTDDTRPAGICRSEAVPF